MSTPKSETVTLELAKIRERCKELLEEAETPAELRLEDTDEPAMGRDPYNQAL